MKSRVAELGPGLQDEVGPSKVNYGRMENPWSVAGYLKALIGGVIDATIWDQDGNVRTPGNYRAVYKPVEGSIDTSWMDPAPTEPIDPNDIIRVRRDSALARRGRSHNIVYDTVTVANVQEVQNRFNRLVIGRTVNYYGKQPTTGRGDTEEAYVKLYEDPTHKKPDSEFTWHKSRSWTTATIGPRPDKNGVELTVPFRELFSSEISYDDLDEFAPDGIQEIGDGLAAALAICQAPLERDPNLIMPRELFHGRDPRNPRHLLPDLSAMRDRMFNPA
jgi:hypothetical protein